MNRAEGLERSSIPEVLDLWFEHVVKPRLQGEAELVRFADDFVRIVRSDLGAGQLGDRLSP